MTIDEARQIEPGDIVLIGDKGIAYWVAGIEDANGKIEFTLKAGPLNTKCDYSKISSFIKKNQTQISNRPR